ncbi:nitroreductase family protein [Sporolactobacillus sp. STSJ-5]|uniref:nitroreductase family protein n=1 Tax=Sporolactobacillus sp. STSJ-5 TaxID=2965076 RepID=UPI00210768E1|nr:nitroreductase family protein [Sporolactobacillus sp. STSJ-5]MCQ2011271.1 nitroreductase family protein [Sporolactobacillus sp. STSJ-5]
MEKTQSTDFFDVMNNRHSVKNYDQSVKISHLEMTEMLMEAAKAPSSVNLQPWRFVVVDEHKERLESLVRFNQNQLNTSSAMILILGDMNHPDYAEEIFADAVEKNLMSQEVKDYYMNALPGVFSKMTKQQIRENTLIDGGLVAMQLMLVAKAHGYDTNPIGGFERKEVMQALGVDTERYVPIMLLAIGKAAKPAHPSVRLPIEKLVSWNHADGVVGMPAKKVEARK